MVIDLNDVNQRLKVGLSEGYRIRCGIGAFPSHFSP
jgi:hypothetical protein